LSNPIAPALGERRAAGGLQAQYRVAAFLTYEALLNGTLEGVRLADPEAGRVDDFQLLSLGRLDAYSVKWESHPEPFTLHKLISHLEDKPSLIAQLADGWKKLRARDSDRHVVVHLATNAYPSTRGEGPLAHFWTECWKPRANQAPESPIPARWQEVWEKIQIASGLAPDEFRAFTCDCGLDFQFVLPEPSEPGASPSARDRQARFRDLNDLAQAFFNWVAAPRPEVEIPRSQLIEELRWHGRLELRHPHEFREPAIYQEIEPTVDSLKQSLERLAGGYILLLGTPGSGKSTLLTQTLKYRQERSVRYYAFVPQAQNTNRGESENFLHDITLMLAERGFRAGQSLPGFDRLLLAERLDAQLRLLHEDWQQKGRRTILLIDGLDHIPREQSPTRSLLADLPSPSRVPDGVYILLGSQTDQLRDLPSDVVDQIQQPERRITMEPLGREAVRSIVSQAGFGPSLTAEEQDRIYQLSGGHPLALDYLLNRLRFSSSGISQLLANVEPFPGRIDAQYTAHWRQIQSDWELVVLLAMLARVRGGIEIPWVETWASRNALYRLHSDFSHYFRQEPSGRWYFFHNSFRIFLLEKTERLPGISSSTGDQSLYRRLADAAASAGPPWSWDEIFYRVKAGEGDRALKLATLPAFREQLFAGRVWPEAREDLELLLPLTSAQRDVEGLARLLFIGMEIDQRAFNLDEYAGCPVPELLARLGKTRAALDWSREGLHGRLKPKDGLRFAAALAKLGLKEEARRVFDLSEPLDILGGGEAIPRHKLRDKRDLLEVWVEVAPAFRDIPRLLQVIGQIRCEDDGPHFGESSPEATARELQGYLRFRLLNVLRKLGSWSDHARVMSCWDPTQEEDWTFWYWGHIHAAREALVFGQRALAAELVENLLSKSSQRALTPEEQIPLAECLIRVLCQPEEARELLNGVSLQPLSALSSLDLTTDKVVIQFYFHRVRVFLGDRRSLSEVVPDARDRSNQGITFLERAVCLAARLWAAAWANRPWPGSEFGREAENVFRLLFRQPDPDWHSWYEVRENRGYLCRSLIGAARLHGPEALEALQQVFEHEWTHPVASQQWPLDLIRECALELLDTGAPKSWVASWCERTQTQALDERDLPARLEHLASQVLSWLDLDDKDRAQEAFGRLLHSSLGVHTKETQTNSWIAWAARANAVDPFNAPRRLQLLASGLPDLVDKEVLRYAARDLLKAAWGWEPRGCRALFEWMLRQGLTGSLTAWKFWLRKG
jgi:Cdc6-like AAA superfamily ATPase